jgi:hypothetical protein
VRNNPDSTIKERIIKTLTDEALGSRKTILKDIKILEEYGMVYIHKKNPTVKFSASSTYSFQSSPVRNNSSRGQQEGKRVRKVVAQDVKEAIVQQIL